MLRGRQINMPTFLTGVKLPGLRIGIMLTFLACMVTALIAWSITSSASTPSSETLTDVSGPKTYTAGPFNFANGTPVPQLDGGPRCSGANNFARVRERTSGIISTAAAWTTVDLGYRAAISKVKRPRRVSLGARHVGQRFA